MPVCCAGPGPRPSCCALAPNLTLHGRWAFHAWMTASELGAAGEDDTDTTAAGEDDTDTTAAGEDDTDTTAAGEDDTDTTAAAAAAAAMVVGEQRGGEVAVRGGLRLCPTCL